MSNLDPNDFDQNREAMRVVRVEFDDGVNQGLPRTVTETPGECCEEQLLRIENEMNDLYPERVMVIVSDTLE